MPDSEKASDALGACSLCGAPNDQVIHAEGGFHCLQVQLRDLKRLSAWVVDGSLPDEGRLIAFWWGSARPEIGARKGDVVHFSDSAIDVRRIRQWVYLPSHSASDEPAAE